MLPNFLIIGSSRSGTTYLKRALEQHPDIYMGSEGAYTGDIHFFNTSHPAKNWEMGLEWYEKFFDDRTSEKAVGQKSGLYFSDPEAPRLLRQVLGEKVKLIATLRNPMNRAYSSYWYQIEDIPKGVSFLEACELENNNTLMLQSLLHRPGFYYEHLTNYLQYFKKEQLLFILFEEMHKNPLEELKKVFRFLGVDDSFVPRDYDKKVNQATGKEGITYGLKQSWGFIKQHFPKLYAAMKSSAPARKLRFWLGESSEKAASKKGYPKISLPGWEYLSDLYHESDKKMGEFLGIDLISLWHRLPEHLKGVRHKEV